MLRTTPCVQGAWARSTGRWYRVVTLSLLALPLGCGGDAPAASPPNVSPTPATPVIESDAGGPYEIHEWGLVSTRIGADHVHAHAHGGLTLALGGAAHGGGGGGGGGGGVFHGAGIGKPVLYVHLPAGTEHARFDASVQLRGGDILEHWPPGELGDGEARGHLRWRVEASRGACRGHYPSLESEACRTDDGYCELAEVGAYETDEAACVQVAETQAGVLFYRAEGPGRLPLVIESQPSGDYRVALAEGAHAPGRMLYVRRSPERRGDTRLAIIDAPSAGQPLTLPHWEREGALSLGARAGEAALVELLRERGMSGAERRAFLQAWRTDIFGPGAPTLDPAGQAAPATAADPYPEEAAVETREHDPEDPHAQAAEVERQRALRLADNVGVLARMLAHNGTSAPPSLVPAEHALFYFLSNEDAQSLLPLSFDPPPTSLRRAILVRVNLDPTAVPPGGGGQTLMAAAPSSDAPESTSSSAIRLRLDSSRTVAQGELDVRVINTLLRRYYRQLARCVVADPALGVLELRLVIRGGAVEQATTHVARGGSFSQEMRACVARTARRWRFPETDGVQRASGFLVAAPAE